MLAQTCHFGMEAILTGALEVQVDHQTQEGHSVSESERLQCSLRWSCEPLATATSTLKPFPQEEDISTLTKPQ